MESKIKRLLIVAALTSLPLMMMCTAQNIPSDDGSREKRSESAKAPDADVDASYVVTEVLVPEGTGSSRRYRVATIDAPGAVGFLPFTGGNPNRVVRFRGEGERTRTFYGFGMERLILDPRKVDVGVWTEVTEPMTLQTMYSPSTVNLEGGFRARILKSCPMKVKFVDTKSPSFGLNDQQLGFKVTQGRYAHVTRPSCYDDGDRAFELGRWTSN